MLAMLSTDLQRFKVVCDDSDSSRRVVGHCDRTLHCLCCIKLLLHTLQAQHISLLIGLQCRHACSVSCRLILLCLCCSNKVTEMQHMGAVTKLTSVAGIGVWLTTRFIVHFS